MSGDIQDRIRRHLIGNAAERRKLEAEAAIEDARKLAAQVARRGLRLAKAGKRAEARKTYAEALVLEKEWRKLGGKGTLS